MTRTTKYCHASLELSPDSCCRAFPASFTSSRAAFDPAVAQAVHFNEFGTSGKVEQQLLRLKEACSE